jgi:hypothetical protein
MPKVSIFVLVSNILCKGDELVPHHGGMEVGGDEEAEKL